MAEAPRILKVAQLFRQQTGNDLSTSDYKSRLLLQKNVYLAQEAGIKLDYCFSWYRKGPYSTSLTSEAYQLVNESPILPTNETSIRQVSTALVRAFGNDLKEENSAELLASIVFALKEWKTPMTEKDVIEKIQTVKPKYTAEEIKTALTKIINSNLFSINNS